jgi:uncharacterized lipoprotein YajG
MTPPLVLKRHSEHVGYRSFVMTKEGVMKTLALLTATALLLAGCAQYGGGYYGKGKAPPPAAPVVTKG